MILCTISILHFEWAFVVYNILHIRIISMETANAGRCCCRIPEGLHGEFWIMNGRASEG